MICKHCQAENHPDARHCQFCGSLLAVEKGIREYLDGLNPSSLAGMNLRGSNIFSLGTKDLMNSERRVSGGKVPIRPLEDHSWYCPDCGHHNRPYQMVCLCCGRSS